MPNTTTKMGRVKGSQQFFTGDAVQGDTKPKSNVLVYVLIVVAGAALILYFRNRVNNGARTGPLVVLTQSAAPDQSTIDNLTASINALGHLPVSPFTPANFVTTGA